MDATNMSFRDNSFDISIDKGTYDALAVSAANHQQNLLSNIIANLAFIRYHTQTTTINRSFFDY